jgi:hypothetical protein
MCVRLRACWRPREATENIWPGYEDHQRIPVLALGAAPQRDRRQLFTRIKTLCQPLRLELVYVAQPLERPGCNHGDCVRVVLVIRFTEELESRPSDCARL